MVNLTSDDAGNEITLSQITLPETIATFANKARAPQGISQKELARVIARFLQDCAQRYHLTSVSRELIDSAVILAQRRELRGCDAIQLATALRLNAALLAAELPPLVFIAADLGLLRAAREERLITENPHDHPESKK